MANFYAEYPPQGAGGGVTSLDGLTGAITLVAGTGISIVDGASTITISSTSSGDVTIGAFGSTPNANGLSINGSQVLNMQPADGTNPGGVSITTQTFAGNKTFTGTISASNLSGTNTGDVTLGTASGLSLIGQALSLGLSSTSTTGALSSTDWNTFNNKGSGSVTSVALTVPSFLSVAGSPITTTGTLAVTLSGTALPVSSGGTGQTTLTSHGVLVGAGTSAVTQLAASAAGTVLAGQGVSSDPAFTATPTLGVAGTTLGTLALSGNTSGTITIQPQAAAGTFNFNLPITVGSAGQVLTSQGGGATAMTWTTLTTGTVTSVALAVPATSIFGVTGSPVTSSGTLTLTTTGTSGGIPYFSSTSALSSSGLLAQNGLVLGGGAGATPTTLATSASTAAALISGGTNTAPSWGTLAIGGGGTGQTTKAAAFDALSPMTTGGDIIYGGASGTGTRLANGSSGQVLTSAGGTSAPTWSALTPGIATVTTIGSTYTVLTTDNVILANSSGGSAYNITLYTAVGNSGRTITIKRTNAFNAHAITIATTGGQTIDANTQTTRLDTEYETFVLVSDGSNWFVLDHDYSMIWKVYTPTYTGFGTATDVKSQWRRVGGSLEVTITFTTGTCTAVTAQVSLPTGISIDTASISNSLIGFGSSNGTSTTFNVLAATTDSTHFLFANPANGTALNAQNASAAFANGVTQSFFARIPVSNWTA